MKKSSFSLIRRLACLIALSACALGHARADGTLTAEDSDSTGYDNKQSSTTAFSLSDSSSGTYFSQSVGCSYGALHASSNINVPIVDPSGAQSYDTGILSSADSYTIHLAAGSSGVARFIFHLAGSITGSYDGSASFRVYYEARVDCNGLPAFDVTGDLENSGFGGSQPSDIGSVPADVPFTSDGAFSVIQSLSCATGVTSTSSAATPAGGARAAADITLSNGGFTVVDTNGNPLEFTAESRSGSARGSNVPAGGAFAGFSLTNNAPGTLGTVVELPDGTASAATQVVAAFTAPSPTTTPLVSDTVALSGTNSDPVVIQIHYNVAAAQAAFGTLADLGVAYFRESDGKWVSAALGNTGTGATEASYYQRAYNPATDFHLGYVGNDTANGVVWAVVDYSAEFAVTSLPVVHPSFFTGAVALSNGVDYLQFPSGNPFGYYTYLPDPNYIYHFDLGYEFVFDAADGYNGVYLYDFKSNDFFYTSPAFPFPYLYDFGLNSTVYYYPDPNNAGRYNTNGVRYFYVFNTKQIISK